MLRPERMSRISVTGSARVMEDAIEAVHEVSLLHMSDYDGAWEGFDPGDPVDGANEIAELLVTVRSLESILEVDAERVDPGPARMLDEEELRAEVDRLQAEVTTLDDRQSELEERRRQLTEQMREAEPFVGLGIDLDLLAGYDALEVAVGTGDVRAIRGRLEEAVGVSAFSVERGEEDVLAVFAQTSGEAGSLEELLVGAEFTDLAVPGAAGPPSEHVEALGERREEIEAELATLQEEIEQLREDSEEFLLAAEEHLTIELQKAEAPLSFATTENAFVAEGWIPSIRYDTLVSALTDAIGDHVEIERHGEAAYDADGQLVGGEEPVSDPVAADGGTETEELAMAGGGPPVVQDNPALVEPFEALVEVINRPKYDELDPTIILFLSFPLFFGFMIGDLGYGLLYMLAGALLMRQFDSVIVRSLGGVALWAGAFTALFGVLYGEVFGLHELGSLVWGGHPPIEKGLSPATSDFALLWLVVSLLAGLAHLTIGYLFDFYENLRGHGLVDAVTETGSWMLMLGGIWVWVFADAPPTGAAPPILTGADSALAGFTGFAGFSTTVGFAGIGVFLLGTAILVYFHPSEAPELLNVLVNVLSYTRLAAVLLAKAGMAFVVNLLFFGVWVTETGEGAAWHFGIDHAPSYYLSRGVYGGEQVTGVLFEGLMHGGIGPVVLGLVVLVIGHLLVLVLGVTSAGLQAVRLEYVEFFGKFYQGGGERYRPFGYDRRHTVED